MVTRLQSWVLALLMAAAPFSSEAQELSIPSLNCSVSASNITGLLLKYNITLNNSTNRTQLAAVLPLSWNCTGLAQAQTCPAGLYSNAGSAACTLPCPANYFCPGNGSAVPCTPGTYSLGGADAAGCTLCPAGSYCLNGVKQLCPAGNLSLAGASQCTVPCPPGFYCPQVGYAMPCPQLGTYTLGGAKYNCTVCEAGYQCPTPSSHLFCPPNTWSLPGSTSCNLPCPAGVICPGNGKMSCTVCPAGVFTVRPCSADGDTICNATCPPGMFGAFYTNGFCKDCEKGMYNDKYGMTTCRACMDGKYANATGSSQCIACPAGSNTNSFTGFVNCQKVRGNPCP
jgi:hypothetical protein